MSGDNPRPRVVFDCMVYLQATVSESGPAAALLRLVDSDAFSLFVSEEILEEVRQVAIAACCSIRIAVGICDEAAGLACGVQACKDVEGG